MHEGTLCIRIILLKWHFLIIYALANTSNPMFDGERFAGMVSYPSPRNYEGDAFNGIGKFALARIDLNIPVDPNLLLGLTKLAIFQHV